MRNLKKIGIVFFAISFLIFGWYFFIKANDFEIIINAKTAPGTVYKSVLGWNKGLNKGSDTSTEILQKIPFNKIVHSYNFEPYQLEMDWQITPVNDSITRVSIGVNDIENSLKTRIDKLLGTSPLEKLLDQEFSGFNTVLVKHLQEFKVIIDGIEETPEATVAYRNISCEQTKKALNMINNSTSISVFLKDNGLKIISNPFLEIVDWNKQTGHLNFNFCFPIEPGKTLPPHETIKYKKVKAKKSLKATFYGNYSYTDEAWFALDQYLQDQQINRLPTITEIFYENPHTVAEKDINWKAAIYMEIE